MGAYRDYPNQIQDYKFNIKSFNSRLARKLIDEEEEEKEVKRLLKEGL